MMTWDLGGTPFRAAGQQDNGRILYPFITAPDGSKRESGGFGWVEVPQTYDVKFYENTEQEVRVFCAAGQESFLLPVFFQEFAWDEAEEIKAVTGVRWLASSRELDDELEHQWCVRFHAGGDDFSRNIPISWIRSGISVTAFGTPLHEEGPSLLVIYHTCDNHTQVLLYRSRKRALRLL